MGAIRGDRIIGEDIIANLRTIPDVHRSPASGRPGLTRLFLKFELYLMDGLEQYASVGSTMATKRVIYHVVPSQRGNGWAVRKVDSSRAGRVFPTKQAAVGYSKNVAKREQSELYIHRSDGTIQENYSYRQGSTAQRG